jgi:hypothetical protein
MIRELLQYIAAQRLAAQSLGRLRYIATILARFPQSQLNVLFLSLGQVGYRRVLGK